MNIIGIIVSILYIGLVMMGAKVFEKKSKEASRKFIHIMLGNWWFIAMYYFTNVWFAAILPLAFIIINYISYKKNLIKIMEREKNDGLGTVYYAIALLILVIVSFGIYNKPSLGLIPTLVMAYGDGLAAVIGKTLAGSITMFIVTTILIGGYLAFIHSVVFWETAHWTLVSIMMAYVITSLEAISIKGTDNITVPIATLAMLILIG